MTNVASFGQSNLSHPDSKTCKNIKMFSKITYLSICVIVTLLVSLRESKCDISAEHGDDKEQAVNAAYEYYKNLYLNFYGDSNQPSKASGSTLGHSGGAFKPSVAGFLNKQDLSEMVTPEISLIMGLTGAVLGVVSLIGLVVNANSISSLSTDQDSICNVVQAYSSDITLATISDLTGASADTAATNAEFLVIFNKIENKINALTSPDCD